MALVKKIAGYYYDEEKNRYFKITKDFRPARKQPFIQQQIKRKKKDESKLKLIMQQPIFGFKSNTLVRLQNILLIGEKDICKRNSNFFNPSDDSSSTHFNDVISLKVNTEGNKLMLMMINYDISFYDIVEKDRKLSLKNVSSIISNQTQHALNKTDCHWSPWMPQSYLITQVNEKLLRPGFLRNSSTIEIFNNSTNPSSVYVARNQSISSSSWCENVSFKDCIVYGEKDSIVFLDIGESNVKRRCRILVQSVPTYIETLEHCPGLVLGLKCGELSFVDMRSSKQVAIETAREGRYCIECIRKQRDENYITVSNLGGSIFTMDLRMRKTVSTYLGHVNNASASSFCFDWRGDFLYAVGRHSRLRVWDVRTSELKICKQLFPSLQSIECSTPTAFTYCKNWTDNDFCSGLLFVHNNFYQFLNTE